MELYNILKPQIAEQQNDWHQAATDGQWIAQISEDAMHFKTDDDDDDDAPTLEDWGDVDPQPSTGPNEPSAPGSAV